MSKEYLTISDGTFTLSESENENKFYFYRNDRGVLTDIDREYMDLYQSYITHKMINGEITGAVMSNICAEISDDEKVMRLTVCEFGEKPVEYVKAIVREDKRPNFIKRLFNKIRG